MKLIKISYMYKIGKEISDSVSRFTTEEEAEKIKEKIKDHRITDYYYNFEDHIIIFSIEFTSCSETFPLD